jgi:predicted small secreted protein
LSLLSVSGAIAYRQTAARGRKFTLHSNGVSVFDSADAFRGRHVVASTLRKMIMMQKFLAVAVAVWIGLLAGCNTMDGFGRDMERGGEKIQEKAKK